VRQAHCASKCAATAALDRIALERAIASKCRCKLAIFFIFDQLDNARF
jgi:hypothetical protein